MVLMRIKPLALATPLVLSLMFAAMSTTEAHAYLDGGSGSMLLQLLLGGVAGLAVAAKLYWYKLLSLFGIKPKAAASEEAEAERATQR
jgi:hypothetical protein